MTREELFLAIGDIPDALIAEAAYPAARMRRARMWRTVAIAAVVMVLLCATAFAAGVIYMAFGSSHSNIPDYTGIPSRQTLEEDVGFATDMVEVFSNGYRFRSASIVKNRAYDADGNVVVRYLGLHCVYRRGLEQFDLNVDCGPERVDEDIETAEIYDGRELKYDAYLNKFVPVDYQLTEQDKLDEESGKYVFSYGSADVDIDAVQLVLWEDAGLNYSICVMDSKLNRDELIQMAREIIDKQERTE